MENRLVQVLEARRLLAGSGVTYFLPDYDPSSDGLTWHYVGTRNFEKATLDAVITRTSDAITTSSKIKSASGATSAVDVHTLIGQSGPGSLTVSESAADGSRVRITYSGLPNVLNGSVKVGAVATTFNLGVTGKFTTTDGQTIVLSGTETRNNKLAAYEVVTLPDTRFFYGLKLVLDRTRTMSGKISGKAVTLVEHTVVTEWLAKGIGPVVIEGTDSYELTSKDGIEDDDDSDTRFTLQSSPLFPDVKSEWVSNTNLLVVGGTPGNDDIRLVDDGIETFVYAGAVGKRFARHFIDSIQVFAGDGNDVIVLDEALGAYVDAGAGNDVVRGSSGSDTLTGGAGKDTLDGAAGDDRLNGNGGHDHFIGGEGADRLYGGDGNDTIEGNAGVDRIWGGAGDDLLTGGASNDKLYGEDGADQIYGGSENDLLDGGPQSDSLFGDAGDDMLQGLDSTPDHLDGGDGNDTAQHDSVDILANI